MPRPPRTPVWPAASLAVALLMACTAVGGLASAQAPPARGAEQPPATDATSPDPAAASEKAAALKARGDAAMRAVRFAEALEAYDQSHALVPDPALLYNRGRALQALGRFPDALEAVEAFAAQAPPELRARVPKLAELVAELRSKTSAITVTCNVSGARVLVRDLLIGTTPLKGPVRLNAGAASLEVTADGYHGLRQSVALPAGGVLAVPVTLRSRATTSVLTIVSTASGARVRVDGSAIGVTPAETIVAPGEHRIEVERDGYEPFSTTVVVRAGTSRRFEVTLSEEAPSLLTRWWLWTSVAVVVAGGVALAVAAITERGPDTGDIPPGVVSAPIVAPPSARAALLTW